MSIFIFFLCICIPWVEGKNTKSLRFEQFGVSHPQLTGDIIPDDSNDTDRYYILDYDVVKSRVAVYDVWYNTSDTWDLEDFYGKGSKCQPERQSLQPPESNYTNRKLLQQQEQAYLEMAFGVDEREPVYNTQIQPWNTIGLIRSYNKGVCTGALVSSRMVLTAAHCLFDQENGKFYGGFTFSPGENAISKPYGEYKYKHASVTQKYSREKDDRYDFGILLLEDAPNVGHMGYGYGDCGRSTYNLNIAGYPVDKIWQTGMVNMYWEYCENTKVDMCPSYSDVSVVYHICDTFSGMSGAPMWVYYTSTKESYIRAIHYGSVTDPGNFASNTAAAITPYVYDFILAKKAEWGE